MLMRKNDAPLDFDLAKVIEQSQDNPVFYVQYAHARARASYARGTRPFPTSTSRPQTGRGRFRLLEDEGERDLMRTLAQYPRVILQAADAQSRTGSPFTPMISRPASTPTGTAARICDICASLMKTMQFSYARMVW